MATRIKVVDAIPKPGRVKQALKNGPHGQQQNADKTLHSTPSKHRPMDPGDGRPERVNNN